MKIIVDYKRWRYGFGGAMKRSDGSCCILGFIGESLGLPKEAIQGGYPMPDDTRWPLAIRTYAGSLYGTNDMSFLTLDERIAQLKVLLQGIGYEMEVINLPEKRV